jgi:hypothetical protein
MAQRTRGAGLLLRSGALALFFTLAGPITGVLAVLLIAWLLALPEGGMSADDLHYYVVMGSFAALPAALGTGVLLAVIAAFRSPVSHLQTALAALAMSAALVIWVYAPLLSTMRGLTRGADKDFPASDWGSLLL